VEIKEWLLRNLHNINSYKTLDSCGWIIKEGVILAPVISDADLVHKSKIFFKRESLPKSKILIVRAKITKTDLSYTKSRSV